MYVFFLSPFFACISENSSVTADINDVTTPSSETADPEIPDSELNNLEGESLGEGSLYPDDEAPHRRKKRMRVVQLQASMSRISGGVEWKNGNKKMWEEYSSTLGVPDYQQSVTEDLSPSIMFQKFLDDAAVYTCTRWIDEEYQGEQRLFFSEIEPGDLDSTKIRQNMVALRQHIHGRDLDADAPIIDSFVELHQLVMQRTADVKSAWTTVCVGFFTHPDFYMY